MDVLGFDIALKDAFSGPAHKASEALEKLSNDLTTAKGKLAGFEAQLALANKLGDVEGHRKYSAAVEEMAFPSKPKRRRLYEV